MKLDNNIPIHKSKKVGMIGVEIVLELQPELKILSD
jgi:hypothetical protein